MLVETFWSRRIAKTPKSPEERPSQEYRGVARSGHDSPGRVRGSQKVAEVSSETSTFQADVEEFREQASRFGLIQILDSQDRAHHVKAGEDREHRRSARSFPVASSKCLGKRSDELRLKSKRECRSHLLAGCRTQDHQRRVKRGAIFRRFKKNARESRAERPCSALSEEGLRVEGPANGLLE